MNTKHLRSNLVSIALVSLILSAVLVSRDNGLPRYLDVWVSIWLPKTIATALAGYLISGLLPLIWWALLRFNAVRAKGPVGAWWLLLILLAYRQWSGLFFDFKL